MNIEDLSQLASWQEWQEKVKASRPNFCASPIYVEQDVQTPEEFERAAEYVAQRPLGQLDLSGKTRDAAFGGRVVTTKACGPVTRMWLDSNVEMDFLRRHLHTLVWDFLDIGAGYGRLAASMTPYCSSFTCVDAVPISTEISREYLQKFAPPARVLSLEEFAKWEPSSKTTVAINIHSWNECYLKNIAAWLAALKELKIPLLFTVSHGQLDASIDPSYYCCDEFSPSFRPLLEREYRLIAEESIGLSNHPHALWERK